MAGAKLSPRQRMIGMMYLVLTALLALNVSKEIINAFVTVNESLEVTKKNFSNQNSNTYQMFQTAMNNDKEKTAPFYNKAVEAGKLSDTLVNYIENLKRELIVKVEKLDASDAIPEPRDIGRKDDYDVPTNFMNGDANDGKGFKASELKAKLEEYKNNLLAVLGPEEADMFKVRFDELLNTEDPAKPIDNKKTWEMSNFYHNPVVATITLLTKFQNDVKVAESEVITHLLRAINLSDFKFDTLAPKVIAPTSYILLGQEYKADVFLAAMSSTSNPEIIVNGKELPVAGGVGIFTDRPGSEGLKKWGGTIRVKKPDNTYTEYKFESEYLAAKPAAVVSADKMNVLYIGVDNPMSISVPGVGNENIGASISGGGGTLSKAGGISYTAKVSTVGEANINVTATMEGKSVPMGTFKYRVKRVPNPVAKVANTSGGNVTKNILLAQSAVIPVMENFDFELYFKVTAFKLTIIPRGKDLIEFDSNNNLITPAMKSALSNTRPGDKIFFEYIKAVGPGGDTRSLNPVNITIQ
ncbi:MAG: gliding motility protein GldM [Bacteroidia bacterium]